MISKVMLASDRADDIFEGESSTNDQADDLEARVYSIKPPGKGDSGMAEEKG